MPQEFYSEKEAQQILGIASRTKQEEISGDDLARMAHELGISESELREAKAAYRETFEIDKLKQQFRSKVVQSLVQLLVPIMSINLIFVFVWAFLVSGSIWPLWPILACSGSLIIASMETYKTLGSDFESKFSNWKLKQDAKNAANQVINKVIKKISKL